MDIYMDKILSQLNQEESSGDEQPASTLPSSSFDHWIGKIQSMLDEESVSVHSVSFFHH